MHTEEISLMILNDDTTSNFQSCIYNGSYKNGLNILLKNTPSNELVMQTLKTIQGTKDAGRDWFLLIDKFLRCKIKMIPCTESKCVYVWNHLSNMSYVALATDDILLFTENVSSYRLLCKELKYLFEFTMMQGMSLKFLNLRIIQSPHGISIYQTQHIECNILRPYWKASYDSRDIPITHDPFPLDPSFAD